MKASVCRNCEHCKKRCWVQRYKPVGYHAIGMAHAYGYCSAHEKRCSEISECADFEQKILLMNGKEL